MAAPYVCPVCGLEFLYQVERDRHHELDHGWSSAMAARRRAAQAKPSPESVRSAFAAIEANERAGMALDPESQPEGTAPDPDAHPIALDAEAFVLSEDEQRSMVLTLEEIRRRGYDLSDIQAALLDRLNESLVGIAFRRDQE